MTTEQMPKPPKALTDAMTQLDRAREALDDRYAELDELEQTIAAERAKLAQDWPQPERTRWREDETRAQRHGVQVAERNVANVRRAVAAEWAPSVAAELEEAISDVVGDLADVHAALERVARIRGLLDELEDAPASTRGMKVFTASGVLLSSITSTSPAGIFSFAWEMAEQARPSYRAWRRANTYGDKRRRDAVLAKLADAETYEDLRAAFEDGPAVEPRLSPGQRAAARIEARR